MNTLTIHLKENQKVKVSNYIEAKQLIRKLHEALSTYDKGKIQTTQEVVAAKIKAIGLPDLLKEEYADLSRSIEEILVNKAFDPIL